MAPDPAFSVRSRGNLVALLAVVLVIAAVVTVWRYAAGEPPHRLTLTVVEGTVQVAGPTGVRDGAQGVVLRNDDRVATGEGGRAVLSLGAETEIRLGPVSSVQVRSIDEDGVRLELENGALQATVRTESGAVRVGNRGREVVATNSDFSMGVRGGVLKVKAERGDLSISGADVTRIVEGMQANIVDRHAELGPVPEALLLRVEWPRSDRTSGDVATVAGRTAPGSSVRVEGKSGTVLVEADEAGRFTAEVVLVEGANAARVVATDPIGDEATAQGPLPTRDTSGPTFTTDVEYVEP